MPKVSVTMTVYNGQKYLQEAIESILNQTFEDFEFIIVNDGSSDKTGKILASYKDPRIKVINQQHQGMAQGRNKGVEASRGEYIAFMDADDISLPERLEVLVNFLDHHKTVGAVGSDIYLANEHGKLTGIRQGVDGGALIGNEQQCPPEVTYMIRREMVEKIGGFRKKLGLASDYDLLLRLAEITILKNISQPLYKWRISLQNDTTARRVQQYKHGKLAERLAFERRQQDKDSLQVFGEKAVKKILDGINLENVEKGKLSGYYFYGKRFYIADDYKSAFKFLIRLFPHDLFNKDTLALMSKVVIKLIFPRRLCLILKKLKDKWRANGFQEQACKDELEEEGR